MTITDTQGGTTMNSEEQTQIKEKYEEQRKADQFLQRNGNDGRLRALIPLSSLFSLLLFSLFSPLVSMAKGWRRR